MKRIIIVATIILLVGTARASDPNSMPTPTLQNPVTVCFEPDLHIVTFKMKFIPDVWAFITNDDSFEPYVNKYWYGGVTSYFRKVWRKKQAEKLTDQQLLDAVIKAESE